MSHTVKIKREFKSISTLRKAFAKLGWELQENSTIRTYPSDPAQNTVYPFVAVNPQKGYDLGIKPGKDIEIFGDFFDQSISQQLGSNLDKLGIQYAKQAVEDHYIAQGYTVSYEELANGSTKINIVQY